MTGLLSINQDTGSEKEKEKMRSIITLAIIDALVLGLFFSSLSERQNGLRCEASFFIIRVLRLLCVSLSLSVYLLLSCVLMSVATRG